MVAAAASGPVILSSPDQLLAAAAAPTATRPAPGPGQPTQTAAAPVQRAPEPSAARRSAAADNPFGWPPEGAANAPEPRQPGQRPAPGGAQQKPLRQPTPYDGEYEDGEFEEEAEPRRTLGFGRIAAALLLAILVGAGVAAAIRPDKLSGIVPTGWLKRAGIDKIVNAAPFVTASGGVEAIDEAFQRSAVWRHVKAEFPDWYGERLKEAAKLAADKRGEPAIAKHLTEAMVTLRRKHADQALTASPERLRFVATAFLDNLQAMAKQNVETCYGFISQGETFPPVLDMLQKPDANQGLQKQLMAVFEAISDGRKAPQSYLPPRKSDYDTLAAELNARGWSENDLRTFSDPRALGRASPQDVCRMVQDWFAAQIAIKDNDAQLRLLVESLRPVVAG